MTANEARGILKDLEYFNHQSLDNDYVLMTEGPTLRTTKILTIQDLAKTAKKLNVKWKTYAEGRDNFKKPRLNLATYRDQKYVQIVQFSPTYITNFEDIHSVKKWLYTQRLQFIQDNCNTLEIDFMNDQELIGMYRSKMGWAKTKKALERLKETFPEEYL